ncbi:hypothetical protein BVRB_8g199350 [Beta vulgaris subsp. vulgaris]|nr:hypothetical protein BVRB_8g199350 [Beta vulgaris subsp. vulgaris]
MIKSNVDGKITSKKVERRATLTETSESVANGNE